MHGLLRNRFLLALIGGCVVIAAGVWLSSGTLAPYAATLRQPRILKPCNYLVNTDHAHFEAAFLMLDGAPREEWDFSIYLRRILYPLLAYPFMKALGFMAGGVVASVILQLAAFVAFVLYVRRNLGNAGAYAAMALVAFYPGIYYWGGLPYNHVAIVPASLLGMLLLWEIEKRQALRRIALLALLLGVLFLAYDLLPLFGPAAVLILLLRRPHTPRASRWAHAAIAAVIMVLPMLLTHALLNWRYHLPFRNKNTQTYYDLLQAYLAPSDLPYWGQLVANAPGDFVRTFFFSNFWFLPALFLVICIVNRFTTKLRMTGAEKWLLLTTVVLFAFINLAPPTPGWQFRGSQLARIYQPAFAAMILFSVRWFQAAWETGGPLVWRMSVALAAVAIANAVVILGPALQLPLADRVYLSFYRHAQSYALAKNLDTFGRRPLGFCDTSITLKSPPTNRELNQLKQRNRLRRPNPPKKKKRRPPASTAMSMIVSQPPLHAVSEPSSSSRPVQWPRAGCGADLPHAAWREK